MKYGKAGFVFALLAVCASACGSDGGSSSGLGGGGKDAGGAGGTGTGGGGTDAASGSGGSDAGGEACTTNDDCAALLTNIEPAGCVVPRCVLATKTCAFDAVDADGDGYKTNTCTADGGTVALGDDCDDALASRYPGAWDGPEDTGAGNADSCNDVDNDCDGTADDDKAGEASCLCDPLTDIDVPCFEMPDGTPISFPSGQPQGSCEAGTKTCNEGVWTDCVGAIAPKAEDSCSAGNDDNCNGTVNDSATCACIEGETATCAVVFGSQGVCGTGMVTCDATGNWPTACPKLPTAEICAADLKDEDCDGSVNETASCNCTNGAITTCGAEQGSKGECAAKARTCINGAWTGSCAASSAELCNTDGKDEDCDGSVNENPPCVCVNGQTGSCGTCNQGSRTCSGGAWGTCNNPNTGVSAYYRDQDGDNYCNKNVSTTACSQPPGYLPASCSSDCKDTNGYATTQCSNGFNMSGNPWPKQWGGGCDTNTWNVCGAGFHVSSCTSNKVSGGGSHGVNGFSGTQCTLWVCDAGFESATVFPSGNCLAD